MVLSTREFLLLWEQGCIPRCLLELWHNGSPSAHESIARGMRCDLGVVRFCLSVALASGVVGAFLLGHGQGASPEVFVNSFLMAGFLLVALEASWNYRPLRKEYAALLGFLDARPGDLAGDDEAKLRARAEKALVKQVHQLKKAEAAESDMPDDETHARTQKERDRLAVMYRTLDVFNLVDSTKGWKPYFEIAEEEPKAA